MKILQLFLQQNRLHQVQKNNLINDYFTFVTVVPILKKVQHNGLKRYYYFSEVESSRTSLASRTSSRTDFEVLGLGLGLEGQVLGLGLGLEASSPRKLACPRLEDSTIFWKVKILWSG